MNLSDPWRPIYRGELCALTAVPQDVYWARRRVAAAARADYIVLSAVEFNRVFDNHPDLAAMDAGSERENP